MRLIYYFKNFKLLKSNFTIMKKIKFIVLFSLFSGYSFSQFSQFDTVKIFASSISADYKNPVFERDYSSFNPFPSELKVAYEEHINSSSSLKIRHFNSQTDLNEYTIVSDDFKNINATLSRDLIVWQSNSNGFWNLKFSKFDNGNYTSPQVIQSENSDQINPYIEHSSIENMYCLSYQRGRDIYFRVFYNNNWTADSNITSHTNDSCSTPKLIYTNNAIWVLYKQTDANGNTLIYRQYIYLAPGNFSSGNRFMYSINNNPGWFNVGGHQNDISLLYDSFVNGFRRSYMYDSSLLTSFLISEDYPGNNFNPKCEATGFLVDNSTTYPFYFGFFNVNYDSLFLAPFKRESYIRRKFYIGNSEYNSNYDMSRLTGTHSFFRVRVIWEKELNGKTALYESNAYDHLSNIRNVSSAPEDFKLFQNYPNPFNPSTIIKYNIPKSGKVKLIMYDMLGKEITVLIDGKQNTGTYEIIFNSEDLTSGVYLYQLQFEDQFLETKKMIILR
jgi:hypothetical protein